MVDAGPSSRPSLGRIASAIEPIRATYPSTSMSGYSSTANSSATRASSTSRSGLSSSAETDARGSSTTAISSTLTAGVETAQYRGGDAGELGELARERQRRHRLGGLDVLEDLELDVPGEPLG